MLITSSASHRGGHSHWKVVWERVALKIPLFRPNFSSRDPPFQAFFPLQRPYLDFLKKIFQDQFLAYETQMLTKICSRDPSFSFKKSVPETLFLKARVARTYPKLFGCAQDTDLKQGIAAFNSCMIHSC